MRTLPIPPKGDQFPGNDVPACFARQQVEGGVAVSGSHCNPPLGRGRGRDEGGGAAESTGRGEVR